MWRVARAARIPASYGFRRVFSSAANRLQVEDEGDWSFTSEWWRDPGCDSGRTVFRSFSEVGNGDVSVVAYPASKPSFESWSATEKWLQERYAKRHPELGNTSQFSVVGYQWRALQFNNNSRQSTAKVMAAHRRDGASSSLFLMQQPHCLAVPYAKSMVSVGLSTLVSLRYDLLSAVHGRKTLRVLCIGHGGGSIPLFMASKIPGAIVHSVEIDPVVISASINAMGFPACALKETTNLPTYEGDIMWEYIHDRLFLFNSDAEKYIQDTTTLYDLVFVDAYDGDDIFPCKLWDSDAPFLKTLASKVHPEHGTVVINLHQDSDIYTREDSDNDGQEDIFPIGKYVSQVSRAYKEQLGRAFAVKVPWLCNVSVVAHRSSDSGLLSGTKESILNNLISGSSFVEYALDLPFPCLQYVKRNFMLFD